jgi:hypothetical protein
LPSAWCRWSALIGTLALLAGALPAGAANLPPQLLILNAANELTAREDTPIMLRLVVSDAESRRRRSIGGCYRRGASSLKAPAMNGLSG